MKKRLGVPLYNIGAVLVGLVISASLLLFLKLNPIEVVALAVKKITSDGYTMGEILVKATPLIFTSLAFAFTYKANLFNIGAQGQFYAGAIAAIALSLALGGRIPQALLILIVLVAAFASGAVVGGLIGFAKSKFRANEFLVSMMSTYVVSALMDFLLRTSLQETKAEYLQTDAIAKSAYLPVIVPGTRVHLGFVIAVMTAILIWVLLYKTPLGFRIRAVGYNHNAAELGGIRSGRIYVTAFLIAGGLAGMAGFTEVNGVQHMLLQNFNTSIGSFGIGIAILANGNPIGCIFASILFGFLNVMGTTMGRLPGLNIPASIIDLIEGVVMICVIMSYFVRKAAETRSEKQRLKKAGGK
ncbi:MAG: ABC transporter permease [Firmicutes bacterium HGW-Firmicutes-9]|jgi:simple sugar transport system permease protein|nr:MAG: ABC transporter permease [Firmicutes bacterium HGW-Firmicutes-9]